MRVLWKAWNTTFSVYKTVSATEDSDHFNLLLVTDIALRPIAVGRKKQTGKSRQEMCVQYIN
jgi:hypothetical protein